MPGAWFSTTARWILREDTFELVVAEPASLRQARRLTVTFDDPTESGSVALNLSGSAQLNDERIRADVTLLRRRTPAGMMPRHAILGRRDPRDRAHRVDARRDEARRGRRDARTGHLGCAPQGVCRPARHARRRGAAATTPRLAPSCLAHWLAGSDHVVVAVSAAGSTAGMERSDRLRRIGGRNLTGRGNDWDTAMRALPRGQASYAVDIDRKGKVLRLVLPCAAETRHGCRRPTWRCGRPSRGATGRHAAHRVRR